MTNYKKIFITGLVAFTVLTTSALAATGTADKKKDSSGSVESVSISGNGAKGNHYTNLYEGTGKGTGKLYKFVRFWPDTLLNTHTLSSEIGITTQQTTFDADADAQFNVVAEGSSSAGIRSSVVIN